MKATLVLVLVVLLLIVGMPLAMGQMGDCPACTSAKTPFALGICAGILSLMALAILLTSQRFRPLASSSPQFLLASSIFRPPRTA